MPLVIPVFIPHEGCPHCCVFCNQRRISGYTEPPVSGSDVKEIVQTWLERDNNTSRQVQVAFYGGSFTGLAKKRQEELLTAVAPFIEQGRVATLRLSTRPDYIDRPTIVFLRRHHVGIVELGVQSLADEVLTASARGHSPADVVKAMDLLHESAMEIGIQLMVGLPGESRRNIRQTVAGVIALRPDFVRIYPVLVVKNSPLAKMYAAGKYQPLSLEKAVLMAAWMKNRFDTAAINVVRMGLQAGPELESSLIAGPWHPAFGELVQARLMFRRVRSLLSSAGTEQRIKIAISPRDESVFRGMKSANMKRLKELHLADSFTLVFDPGQPRNTVIRLP
ncbi:MAG: radical SAM protein [Desulfobulbus sp.]|nr:MAG: radical SAM protein [Desulfobulbus sp.]